ncbi:MAG TPA: haloacid dehalogenase type II [Terriglobales bacterium]|nr:haloacid dehalogenase type II [Terriglobales bacterium]
MRPVIAFDLNGTLLDLSVLDPYFLRTFGDTEARREWFMEVLHSAMVATITGCFVDFATLQKSALEVLAGRRDVMLGSEEKIELLQNLRHLPAFHDVASSLERLRGMDFRLVVLTNSRQQAAEEVLRKAGVRDFFERVFSAEITERYKPAAQVYQMAARELNVEPSALMLVAAHSWDTTGAIRAGCEAAFLERPEQVLDPLAPRPRFVVSDLSQLVGRLADLTMAA